MGEKGIVLEHHADATRLGGDMYLATADHRLGQTDFTRADRLKAGHRTQQGGLATARRANQHAHFTRPQAQGHAVHRGAATLRVTDGKLGNI